MTRNSATDISLNKLLFKYGFGSKAQFFEFLEQVPSAKFRSEGLDLKPRIIYQIRVLMHYIKVDGMMLSEARAMTAPGSIFEGLRSSYSYLNSCYREKRKKLREQLSLVQRLR